MAARSYVGRETMSLHLVKKLKRCQENVDEVLICFFYTQDKGSCSIRISKGVIRSVQDDCIDTYLEPGCNETRGKVI